MTISALTASQIDTITDPAVYDLTKSPYGLTVTNGGITNVSLGPGLNTTQTLDIDTYQGQMVTVQHTISDMDVEMLKMNMGEFKDEVKKQLLRKLMDEIVKNNLIEFTSQTDVVNNHTHYRARIYATPDAQIRRIRKSMKV